MDPKTLGNKQCIDVQEQCYYGQETEKALAADPRRRDIMNSECKKRDGGMIHCCPLELINIPYQPGPFEIPYQVNVENNRYHACPENVKAACFRETERQKPVCIQAACNDAGYRVASNFYEICKAYQEKAAKQDIPDCTTVGCWGNRFRIPEELDEALDKPKEGEPLKKTLERKAKNTALEIQEIKNNIENLKKMVAEEKNVEDVKVNEGFQVGGATETESEKELRLLMEQLEKKEQELDQLNKVLEEKPIAEVELVESDCSGLCLSFDFLKSGDGYYYPMVVVILSILVIGLMLLNLSMLPIQSVS